VINFPRPPNLLWFFLLSIRFREPFLLFPSPWKPPPFFRVLLKSVAFDLTSFSALLLCRKRFSYFPSYLYLIFLIVFLLPSVLQAEAPFLSELLSSAFGIDSPPPHFCSGLLDGTPSFPPLSAVMHASPFLLSKASLFVY